MSASATVWRAMTRRWIAEPLGYRDLVIFSRHAPLSLDQASAFGGKVARWLGHVCPQQGRAKICAAVSTWSDAELKRWWPRYGKIRPGRRRISEPGGITAGGPEPRVELVGQENLEAALAGRAGDLAAPTSPIGKSTVPLGSAASRSPWSIANSTTRLADG